MASKVTHWLGPNKGGPDYIWSGRLYCGAIDRLGKSNWPAHDLERTTCRRCLAKARRGGLL